MRDSLGRLQRLLFNAASNGSSEFVDSYFKNGVDFSEQIDRMADLLGLDLITKEIIKGILENYLINSDPQNSTRLLRMFLPIIKSFLSDLGLLYFLRSAYHKALVGIDPNALLQNATKLSDSNIAQIRSAITFSVDLKGTAFSFIKMIHWWHRALFPARAVLSSLRCDRLTFPLFSSCHYHLRTFI